MLLSWTQKPFKRRSIKDGIVKFRKHIFGAFGWPTIAACGPYYKNFTFSYITGGFNMKERVISDQCCEINLGTGVLVPRTRMPKPKFGHIAQMVGEMLIVAGGISNAMH